jgi:hypothetical protein
MSMLFTPVARSNRPWVSVGNGPLGKWGEWPDASAANLTTTRISRAYIIQGTLLLPSGTTNVIPSFPMGVSGSATLVNCIGYILDGTSVTLTAYKTVAGTPTAIAGGPTSAVVTTAVQSFPPTDPLAVDDKDRFSIVLTALSATPINLTWSFEFDVTS